MIFFLDKDGNLCSERVEDDLVILRAAYYGVSYTPWKHGANQYFGPCYQFTFKKTKVNAVIDLKAKLFFAWKAGGLPENGIDLTMEQIRELLCKASSIL